MKLTHSLAAKIAAIFLFILLAFFAIFCITSSLAMMDAGYYWSDSVQDPNQSDGLEISGSLPPFFPYRYTLPAIGGVSLMGCIILYLFLLCAAGHRAGREEAVYNIQDRIPFDLYVVATVIVMATLASAFPAWNMMDVRAEMLVQGLSSPEGAVILIYCCCITLAIVAFLSLSMTAATRIKTGTFWRNTVVYYVLRLCWRALCWMGRGARTLFRNMGLIWKAILIYSAYALILLLVGRETYFSAMATLWWIGVNITALLALCFFMIQLSRLQEGAKRLAAGELSYHVPTEHMFFALKQHGENLNSIGAGMTRAVEERIKSERLKTELITNVSHDIKTPLTSILNYVDLLKKEPQADEAAKEYIAVLDRQAHRLKKLTEDVLEASKAATGNIKVELAPTDAVELLRQCVAEYEGRFQQAGLATVVQAPEGKAAILADGRLLWRVFDNLLGNIAKYAQRGTRVYAAVAKDASDVVVTLKNISRDALNISEEELMERFVRGDSARSTEGSGLGLSIARSLVELQGGRFGISIDCDLFKVELRFSAIEE